MGSGIPTSKGQVHGEFIDAINTAKQDGVEAAASMRQTQQRQWQGPAVTPHDIEQLGSDFARDAINENYVACVDDAESPGTVGDVIAVKTQGDILATMERGFRARHASSIRCLAHAAGRRLGHGHSQGIFSETSGPLRFVTAALKAGQESTGYAGSTPATPPASGTSP